jgi:acetyl-CoA C-acetyltransferase
MPDDPSRIPVIAGIGQISQREGEPTSLDLTVEALRRAEADAGASFLSRLDTLELVQQNSWPAPDMGERVAAALGHVPRRLLRVQNAHGDTPLRLINDAANRIASGEIAVAAIAGGEGIRAAAQRTAREDAAQGVTGPKRDLMRERIRRNAAPIAALYELYTPTDIYPLFENAMRANWGQTLAEGQAESALIWAGFSEVAAHNPHAWLRKPHSPAEIMEESAGNRPIAFPYCKLMVANNAINQGAAVLVVSLAEARRAGIPESRLIFVGAGAAAHESDHFWERTDYKRSPSLEASIAATLRANGRQGGDFDHVELYSCFPCVPKAARRVLGLSAGRPLTVSGGLTFAGGPGGNYMTHAAAAMVEKLRDSGTHGFLLANGGWFSDCHTLVLSREPPAPRTLPRDHDVQDMADRARDPIPPFIERHIGPGHVETYTVIYRRDGSPAFGTVIGRTAENARFVARVSGDDAATLNILTSGATEPVGLPGRAVMDPKAVSTGAWVEGGSVAARALK